MLTETIVKQLHSEWIKASDLYHSTDESAGNYAEIEAANEIAYNAYQTARRALGEVYGAKHGVLIGQLRQFKEPYLTPDTVEKIAYDADGGNYDVYFEGSWARWDLEDVITDTTVIEPTSKPPLDLSDIPF